MKRRTFLKTATSGASAAITGLPARAFVSGSRSPFIPCINQATTRKADFKTAMDAYSKAGFRVVELWLDSVRPFLEKEKTAVARRVMADHGLEARSSCCECANLFFPGLKNRAEKMEVLKRKLDVSAELGANRFVLCSGIFHDVKPADYEAAIPMLHEIGDLGREFNIVIGVEFIRGAKFLGCVETTAKLLRRVGHPNLGVLIDTFHFYAGISKLHDIERLRAGEVSWVHIDDVPDLPRELLEDKHRIYAGDGVIPLAEILRALAKVYQGPVSFEVFQFADEDPYAVARKGFEGLSRVLARS